MTSCIQQVKALAPELKERFPDLQCLYVFGSQATGRGTKDSDIDLAAFVKEGGKSADPLLNIDMACFCEERLRRPVDFILMHQSNPVLQHEVLATGVRVFEADPEFRAVSESRSFRDYLDNIYFLNRRKLG